MRPRLYQWDQWLDPDHTASTTLVVGRELPPDCDVEKVRRQAYVQASRRKVRITTRVAPGGQTLTINVSRKVDLKASPVGQFFDGQVHRIGTEFEPTLSRHEVYAALVAVRCPHVVHLGFDNVDPSVIVVHAVVPDVAPMKPCPFEGPSIRDIVNPSELEYIRSGDSRLADYDFTDAEMRVVLRELGWASPAQQPGNPAARAAAVAPRPPQPEPTPAPAVAARWPGVEPDDEPAPPPWQAAIDKAVTRFPVATSTGITPGAPAPWES